MPRSPAQPDCALATRASFRSKTQLLMNSVPKPLCLLVAALTTFASPATGAALLGELVTHSSTGEPLRGEIGLLHAAGEEIDSSCFKQTGNPGRDDIPWVGRVSFRLAGDRLIVTTHEPVNHPAAMLGILVTCGGQLRRDYPVLLQPPRTETTPPSAARQPLPPANEPSTDPAFRAAPRRIPSSAQRDGATVASRPARPARHDIAQAQRKPPPEPDHLIVGGLETGFAPLRMSLMLAIPPKTDDTIGSRAQSLQAQRTLAAIDDRITAQLELNERIKRLEEYEILLRERVAHLGVKPAPRPAVATQGAEPVRSTIQPSVADNPGKVQWLKPLAGLLAALVGGGVLIWLRRRGSIEPPTAKRRLTEPALLSSTPPSVQTVSVSPAVKPETTPARAPDLPPLEPPQPEGPQAWTEPTFTQEHPAPFDETVNEHDSALELAEIMMSFGRTQGAAETLADYIRSNPRQAVKPWLKLLEVYHVAGMRTEFELLTRQLNKTFNVRLIGWEDFPTLRATPESIEQLEHINQRLQELWGTPDAQAYIHQILRDNRNGTRQGFPLAVVEEFLLLLAILEDQLGPHKTTAEFTPEATTPATASA